MTTCATNGHLWSQNGWCMFCPTQQPQPQRSAVPVNHVFPGRAPTAAQRVADLRAVTQEADEYLATSMDRLEAWARDHDHHAADRTTPAGTRSMWARMDALERRLRELEMDGNGERG